MSLQTSHASNEFRKMHLVTICSQYSPHKGPLSGFLQVYFATHKALGSNDRRYIRTHLFTIWRRLPIYLSILALRLKIDALPSSLLPWDFLTPEQKKEYWQNIVELYYSNEPPFSFDKMSANFFGYGVPERSFQRLLSEFQDLEGNAEAAYKKAREISIVQLSPPQIDLRANSLKCTTKELLSLLPSSWKAEELAFASTAITINPPDNERSQITTHDLFRKGFYEIQDRSSQATLGLLPQLGSNHRILDYCAGAGGKSLALLGRLQSGQHQQNMGVNNLTDFTSTLSLHDIRQAPLDEARKRLARAGAKAHFLAPGKTHNSLHASYDLVLIDAPCSGSGTWRRQSELKWIFSDLALNERIAKNRKLVDEALHFSKPYGLILYITCSVFPSENELFIKDLECAGKLQKLKEHRFDPTENSDGFYAALCKKI